MSERMMNVSGSSTPKDVETMLQLVYLYFTDIRKDDKSFNTLMQQMEVGLKNRDLSWETAFGDSVNYALYDHSPFVRPLVRSEEHTSELQSRQYLVCRLLLEKKIHAIDY